MTTPGFFDTLERQLGDNLERTVERRRTRRRVLERSAGIAVAVIAMLGAVLFVNRGDVAEAGVDVETSGGLVYIRLTDVEYRPQVIEDAAAAAGIDVRIEAVPTGPSLVGRFVGDYQSSDLGTLKELGADGPGFTGFVVPAGFDGTLILNVGRPAKDGEPYDQSTNAVGQGEPLACTGILGLDAPHAVDLVEDHQVDAAWRIDLGGRREPISASELGQRKDLHVAQALALSANRVVVTVVADGVTLPETNLTAPATC